MAVCFPGGPDGRPGEGVDVCVSSVLAKSCGSSRDAGWGHADADAALGSVHRVCESACSAMGELGCAMGKADRPWPKRTIEGAL